MALPKVNRLKHRYDFSAVYQRGIRRKSPCLTLRALRHGKRGLPNVSDGSASDAEPDTSSCTARSQTSTRIGISISQKVSKRAVVRNRIRRQLRACFRQLLPSVSMGWDLVIVVHPQAVRCDYFQFLQELEQLMIDAEVLDGHP